MAPFHYENLKHTFDFLFLPLANPNYLCVFPGALAQTTWAALYHGNWETSLNLSFCGSTLILGIPYIFLFSVFAYSGRLHMEYVLKFLFHNDRYIDSAGLSGPLPSSFSKLTRIIALYVYKTCFVSNCFVILLNLILCYSLLCFRWASDNDFTGKIPEYFGSWSNLTDL